MDDAMDRADVRIQNTDSLESFRDTMRTVLVDGPEALP
jgi:hypothetical protein